MAVAWGLIWLLGSPVHAQDAPAEPPGQAPAEAAEKPLQRVLIPHAELRGELVGDGLQGLPTGQAALGFGVSRGRVGAELRPMPGVRSLVVLDVRQNDAASTVPVGETGESVRVDAYAGDWEAHLPFAYVEARGETGPLTHRLTAGVQRTLFGVRDAYDLDDAFYVPHPSAFKDLGRRSGLIPSFDLGVLYSADFQDLGGLDLAVSNGSGWRSVEDNFAKHLTARLRITPVPQLEVRATGLAGWEGATNETVLLAWQASAQLRVGPARLVVEGLGGKRYAPTARTGMLGVAGALGVDLALPPASLERLSPVVSLQRYDPTTGAAAGDAWTLLAVGAPLYWKARNDLPFWTGLAWELAVTEDPERPVNHTAALQVGWRI